MGVMQGQKVHEQSGQKGQRQLFDCHQDCGIICVVNLFTEFNLFHFRIIKHLFTPRLVQLAIHPSVRPAQ